MYKAKSESKKDPTHCWDYRQKPVMCQAHLELVLQLFSIPNWESDFRLNRFNYMKISCFSV